MNKKHICLFVEGDTEIVFYKELVKYIHMKTENKFNFSIDFYNIKGIGNFKVRACRKMRNIINTSKKNKEDHYVILCVDNDVFEFSEYPPVNLEETLVGIKNAGAVDTTKVVAEQSIEDWFMYDKEGILNYLGLQINIKNKYNVGIKNIEYFFKLKNKVYIKGKKAEGFIEALDMKKILSNICNQIKPLCKFMELDCNVICEKTDDNIW